MYFITFYNLSGKLKGPILYVTGVCYGIVVVDELLKEIEDLVDSVDLVAFSKTGMTLFFTVLEESFSRVFFFLSEMESLFIGRLAFVKVLRTFLPAFKFLTTLFFFYIVWDLEEAFVFVFSN